MTTIEQAKEEFKAKVGELTKDPVHCPVCGRKDRVYRWHIYPTMVRCLSAYFRLGAHLKPVHHSLVEELYAGKGDETRLAAWGLLRRADHHGGRGGEWYITSRGLKFIKGQASVPYEVYVFRSKWVGQSDKQIYVHGVVENFDWEEMVFGDWLG